MNKARALFVLNNKNYNAKKRSKKMIINSQIMPPKCNTNTHKHMLAVKYSCPNRLTSKEKMSFTVG